MIIACAYDERKTRKLVAHICDQREPSFPDPKTMLLLSANARTLDVDTSFPLRVLYGLHCVRHKRKVARIPFMKVDETQAFYVLFQDVYAENEAVLEEIFAPLKPLRR